MRARLGSMLVLVFAWGAAHARESAPAQAGAQDPVLVLKRAPSLGESNAAQKQGRPVFGQGDAMHGRIGRDVTLEGESEMRRAGTVVRADRLTYWETDDEVAAVGRVRMVRQGNVFTGPELQLKVEAGEGYFRAPAYQLPLYGGRGRAERAEFLGEDRVRLIDASYTTCVAADPDWYLRARSITVDQTAGEGKGEAGELFFKGQRLLKAPSFGFALGDERRSGFLAPSFALLSKTGLEILAPYYFNIAPNRDFTMYNRFTSQRGLQVGGDLRYLEPSARGNTMVEINPNDPLAGRSRYMVWSRHSWANFMGWNGAWNFKQVSDDNYFVDYGRTIMSSAERSLPQMITAGRGVGPWSVSVAAVTYQNILEARNAPPYEQLPAVSAAWGRRDVAGFDMGTVVGTTVFRRPLMNATEGVRFIANPSISYPIVRPGWFVTPRMSLHASAYELERTDLGPTSITRMLPTFSVDSGLVFERQANLFGQDRLQTLEPRLFYLRTPYRDQSQIPVFDTAAADFSFAQLFTENRFIGNDRIGDSHQVTTALVSRLIDPANGAETLRLAFGQRYYLSDQRVQIPGIASRTDTRSDLLMVLSANLTRRLTLDTGVQYNLADRSVPVASTSLRWRSEGNLVFNNSLRYLRDDIGQFDTSWRLPLGNRWTSLARVNYSFLKERVDPSTGVRAPATQGLVEAVVGFEYRDDCWGARVVMQRFVPAAGVATSALFFQLELAGLGRLGNSPFDILRRNIPGYRLPTDRPVMPSRYFGYE